MTCSLAPSDLVTSRSRTFPASSTDLGSTAHHPVNTQVMTLIDHVLGYDHIHSCSLTSEPPSTCLFKSRSFDLAGPSQQEASTRWRLTPGHSAVAVSLALLGCAAVSEGHRSGNVHHRRRPLQSTSSSSESVRDLVIIGPLNRA